MTRNVPNTVLLMGITLSLASGAAGDDSAVREYHFTVPGYLYDQYADYTADFDPITADSVKQEGLWRHLAELAIFQAAPVRGGCGCRVVYERAEVESNFVRDMIEISAGRTLSYPVAAFHDDAKPYAKTTELSEPVLLADEFFVGFYTNAGREEILSLTEAEDIRALRFSAVTSWQVDMDVLQSRDFTIVQAADWYAVMRMIKGGRADVVLQPFARSDDFSTVDGVSGERLQPIPGFKMPFPHARSYVVSTEHPDGAAFLEALNAGITQMRESGVLLDYMTKAGVIDPRIKDFDDI